MKTSAVFLILACFLWVAAKNPDIRPNGRRHYPKNSPQAVENRARPNRTGITYHGGPIMLGTTNVYYVWYGDWNGNTATTILPEFASAIGGSPYFGINAGYYDAAGAHVSNLVRYGTATSDAYSQGKAPTDSQIFAVVAGAIAGGKLPKDPAGVYFVLTSADVAAASGFCSQYCGWHSHGSVTGTDIKYAYVGNPDRCPSACMEQSVGPNGNAGADGMASIIAHELEEAVTDETFNAWYDRKGYENADKCAWNFLTTYSTSNGAKANMKLGVRDFLIQSNWKLETAGCALN